MHRRWKAGSQAGYALMEVLIAAAIMALVVATSAVSLRIALQGNMRLAESRLAHDELQNILAQAKAGLSLRALEDAYPAYTLTLSPVAGHPSVRAEEARPTLLTVTHKERPTVTIQSVLLRTETELSR